MKIYKKENLILFSWKFVNIPIIRRSVRNHCIIAKVILKHFESILYCKLDIKRNSFALHGKDKISFSVLLFRERVHITHVLVVENWGIIKNISWQFSIIWLMNCKTMTIPQCFLQMFLSLTPPKSMNRLSLDFWGK